MGRLVADPELKSLDDTSVCNFRIACERDYAKKGKEKGVDYISVEAWRNTAEFVSKWFKKGRAIVLVGRIQEKKWTDSSGNKRSMHIIAAEQVYFGGDSPKKDNKENNTYGEQEPSDNSFNPDFGFDPSFDDDSNLPF